MSVPSRIADDPPVPSLAALRELTLSRFHRNACNFQTEFAQAVLEGMKHILLQVGCGMGKTLGFWIPLLVRTSGFLVVVTPLTLLGNQHVENLMDARIQAINVDAGMRYAGRGNADTGVMKSVYDTVRRVCRMEEDANCDLKSVALLVTRV